MKTKQTKRKSFDKEWLGQTSGGVRSVPHFALTVS